MAGKKGNKAHANDASFTTENLLNNNIAEKWTFDDAKNALIEVYKYAVNNTDVLCLQDAYFGANVSHSAYYYLIEKFPVLDKIKTDTQNFIISRVNKGGMTGDFNPTASIWRMKQLGEKDTQYQENKNTNTNINIDNVKKINFKDLSVDENDI